VLARPDRSERPPTPVVRPTFLGFLETVAADTLGEASDLALGSQHLAIEAVAVLGVGQVVVVGRQHQPHARLLTQPGELDALGEVTVGAILGPNDHDVEIAGLDAFQEPPPFFPPAVVEALFGELARRSPLSENVDDLPAIFGGNSAAVLLLAFDASPALLREPAEDGSPLAHP
jgi:hypothetical protein